MEALINGVKVPNSLLGELKDTNLKNATDEKLRQSLNDNGYILLRNVIEKNDITKINSYRNFKYVWDIQILKNIIFFK